MPKSGYQCGLAGVNYLPKVLVSPLPELVDFSDTEKVTKFLAFKNSLSKSDFDKEQAEKVVIDGIKAYFEENSQEDVFVLFNQQRSCLSF